MKRFLIAFLTAFGLAGTASATYISYDQTVANQVVTTTTSFTINASTTPIDLLTAQVTLSSHTPAAVTFKDGTQSTGTITIVDYTALAAQKSSDTVTVSNNSTLIPQVASVTVTVSNNSGLTNSTLTVVGVALKSGIDWTIGAVSSNTAASITTAINNRVPNVTAVRTNSQILVAAISSGTFGNSYRVTTSTVAITFSTAGVSNLFSGGTDNSTILLNGYALKQGEAWSKQDTSSNTAISIMDAINSITAYEASTNTTTSVLIKCSTAGSYCNSTTLSVTGSGLTALSPTFRAGQDNAFLKINGVVLVQGTDFTASVSSASTANSIAAAINANSSLSSIIVATAPAVCTGLRCGVVVATGTVSLTGNNYAWVSSTRAAMSITNAGLFGGTTTGYLLNGTVITIPSHGLATGEGVRFSTGVVAISGLVNQTTYYVIKVDADHLGLASSNANAQAGTYITLASSSTTGPHTFTLTPIALSGTFTITWQASDDNVNWADMNVSAATFVSPYTTASTIWDFGAVNTRYFRAYMSGPDTGGVNVNLRATGKRYGF